MPLILEDFLEPISTYDMPGLVEHFRLAVRRPKWWPWLGRLDLIDAGVTAGQVEIGKFKELWRDLTDGQRYSYSAWLWLRPSSDAEEPTARLSELESIRRAAGLDHVGHQQFADRLVAHCKEYAHDYPRLCRWVTRRIALLEFWSKPPTIGVPEDAREALLVQDLALLRAAQIAVVDPDAGLELAVEILPKAMDAAAAAAKRVFGAAECQLSANLMVPVVGEHAAFTHQPVMAANAASAAQMWGQEHEHQRRLVIVAETTNAKHLGFWIPCIRGFNGEALPGAGMAHEFHQGAAVFLDDLPPLRGFGPTLEARWHSHMRDHFHESLFFSLPFRVPSGASGTAAAVLNVNVRAGDLKPWRRAYHPEWLKVARDAAEPFVAVAYRSMLLMSSHIPGLHFDTGSSEWDTLLPSGESPLALEERDHEEP